MFVLIAFFVSIITIIVDICSLVFEGNLSLFLIIWTMGVLFVTVTGSLFEELSK